jgi:hypothetical protein
LYLLASFLFLSKILPSFLALPELKQVKLPLSYNSETYVDFDLELVLQAYLSSSGSMTPHLRQFFLTLLCRRVRVKASGGEVGRLIITGGAEV